MHAYHALNHSYHICNHMQAHISHIHACGYLLRLISLWLTRCSCTCSDAFSSGAHAGLIQHTTRLCMLPKAFMYMHVFLNANTYDIYFCNLSQTLLFDFQHKQKPSWPQNQLTPHSLQQHNECFTSNAMCTQHTSPHQIIFWAPLIYCLM